MRPVIYELVVRLFGNTKTSGVVDGTLARNGVGRFADINATALAELKALGVTHVWLMGVLRQATLTPYEALGLPSHDPDIVKGRAGSFYAVVDYFDVCPDYALEPSKRLSEFDALVERIHRAGMHVMLDLVANHVSRAYGSVVQPELDFGRDDDPSRFFQPDNNFFYLVDPPGQALQLQRPAHWNPADVTFDGRYPPEDGTSPARVPKATGNDVTSPAPAASDWYETVKLNWGLDFVSGASRFDPIPKTWRRMDQVIAYWQRRGVDGFRCDMAPMVPAPAWSWLIERARARAPHTYFLAEAYADAASLLGCGFDSVYHAQVYEGLKLLYQGDVGADYVAGLLEGFAREPGRSGLVYLENHDERRVASPVVRSAASAASGFGSSNAARQLLPLVALAGAGPVLIHNGQEVGETGAGSSGFSGDDGRTSIFDYTFIPALQAWVSEHRYNGAGLDAWQKLLRKWYAELLALIQERAFIDGQFRVLAGVEGTNNQALAFARWLPSSGCLWLVVANVAWASGIRAHIRVPRDLQNAAGLANTMVVDVVLSRQGRIEQRLAESSRACLADNGLQIELDDQSAAVLRLQ